MGKREDECRRKVELMWEENIEKLKKRSEREKEARKDE